MRSNLLFWQQTVLSASCKHLNNLRMSFFFIQTSVKCCHITIHINDVFSILIEQYFIETLQNILKLVQGF